MKKLNLIVILALIVNLTYASEQNSNSTENAMIQEEKLVLPEFNSEKFFEDLAINFANDYAKNFTQDLGAEYLNQALYVNGIENIGTKSLQAINLYKGLDALKNAKNDKQKLYAAIQIASVFYPQINIYMFAYISVESYFNAKHAARMNKIIAKIKHNYTYFNKYNNQINKIRLNQYIYSFQQLNVSYRAIKNQVVLLEKDPIFLALENTDLKNINHREIKTFHTLISDLVDNIFQIQRHLNYIDNFHLTYFGTNDIKQISHLDKSVINFIIALKSTALVKDNAKNIKQLFTYTQQTMLSNELELDLRHDLYSNTKYLYNQCIKNKLKNPHINFGVKCQ